MSLTSYRAAPPRVNGKAEYANAVPKRRRWSMEEGLVLGWPGDDLLSRVLRHSTISAEAFNGRVRDGIGFWAPRSDHRTGEEQEQANE